MSADYVRSNSNFKGGATRFFVRSRHQLTHKHTTHNARSNLGLTAGQNDEGKVVARVVPKTGSAVIFSQNFMHDGAELESGTRGIPIAATNACMACNTHTHHTRATQALWIY